MFVPGASLQSTADTPGAQPAAAGALDAGIALFRQSMAAGFADAHDGGAGIAKAYTPPPAHTLDLAAGHHH